MKHSLSRTLPGFKTRVRYEFNRLESNCTWSRPYQLAPAFREAESVDSRRSFVARKFSRDTSCSPKSFCTRGCHPPPCAPRRIRRASKYFNRLLAERDVAKNQNCFGKNPLNFAIVLTKGRPIVNVAENQIFVYQPK